MSNRAQKIARMSQAINGHETNLDEAVLAFVAFREAPDIVELRSEVPAEELQAVITAAFARTLHDGMNSKGLAVLLTLAIQRLVEMSK